MAKDSNDSPPFATKDGRPKAQDGGGSGGHDFTKDPKTGAPPVPGRDFTKESRDQSQARREVDASKAEQPADGPWPDFKPNRSGDTGDTTERTPFKNLTKGG